MSHENDRRIVMTLDAGGTNFVFSAIRGNEQIIEDVVLPSHADDLDKSIASLLEGFEKVRGLLGESPAAISFAFPGPADYPRGIIGDLPNLPAFRGGVALGPMLEDRFGVNVYINNDGDLYAYGEAIAGFLPYVNGILKEAGSPKRYRNLLGLTIGTGFGAGIVCDGKLLIGDNSIGGEIWLARDKLNPQANIEHHVSIRGLRRVYATEAGIPFADAPTPKELHDICRGTLRGNVRAAREAFRQMGEAAGDAIANAVTLLDGLVVIGGGVAGASEFFLPALIDELNSTYVDADGRRFRRLIATAYNLDEADQRKRFVHGSLRAVRVYGSSRELKYDPEMRIAVGVSRIGTSRAMAIGAYAFALKCLDSAS